MKKNERFGKYRRTQWNDKAEKRQPTKRLKKKKKWNKNQTNIDEGKEILKKLEEDVEIQAKQYIRK